MLTDQFCLDRSACQFAMTRNLSPDATAELTLPAIREAKTTDYTKSDVSYKTPTRYMHR
jgi:hypothetical protein